MPTVESVARAIERATQEHGAPNRFHLKELDPAADVALLRSACGLVNARGGVARVRGHWVEVGAAAALRPRRAPTAIPRARQLDAFAPGRVL